VFAVDTAALDRAVLRVSVMIVGGLRAAVAHAAAVFVPRAEIVRGIPLLINPLFAAPALGFARVLGDQFYVVIDVILNLRDAVVQLPQ